MTNLTVVERLALVNSKPLRGGSHLESTGEMCVMEAVAFVAGEQWSDTPQCVSPTIGAFLRSWNDALPGEERDRLLKPLIPMVLDTAHQNELKLSYMALDWLWRIYVPTWMDLTPTLVKHAEALRTMNPIVDSFITSEWDTAWGAARAATGDTARGTAWAATGDAARDAAARVARVAAGDAAAWAARAAAGNTAWDTAGNAAWNTPWDTTRTVAWDVGRTVVWDVAWAAARTVAWDVAWGTAWDAAWNTARAAAWDAAWNTARAATRAAARDALAPTVKTLQKSAIQLVERMCNA